ncbi:hypothetical protein AOLI_G00148980 [Acnodon oligacanthus]
MFWITVVCFPQTEEAASSDRCEALIFCQMGIMAGWVVVLQVPRWRGVFVALRWFPMTIMRSPAKAVLGFFSAKPTSLTCSPLPGYLHH